MQAHEYETQAQIAASNHKHFEAVKAYTAATKAYHKLNMLEDAKRCSQAIHTQVQIAVLYKLQSGPKTGHGLVGILNSQGFALTYAYFYSIIAPLEAEGIVQSYSVPNELAKERWFRISEGASTALLRG